MNDVNSVVLVGRLTRDPDVRETSSTTVCRLGLAVTRDKKIGQQWEPQSHFFDVTVFGGQAGAAGRYLKKGSKVAVQGHLEFSQWEDRDTGQKRSKVGVIAEQLQFMDTREQSERPPQSQRRREPERFEDIDPDMEERGSRIEQRSTRSDIPNDLPDDDDPDSEIPF